MINRSFQSEEPTTLSSSAIEEELMNFDYQLMIQSPHLQSQSLNNKLCFKNYLQPASELLREINSSQNDEGVWIEAQCPNVYIQKLRGIYMILLRLGYEQRKQKFILGWKKLRHRYYCRDTAIEVRKKFLAEFVNMVNYSEGTKKIKETINKYEVMDEILIDMLIEEINCLPQKTADDNYNICLFLNQIGLKSSVISFYEFEIEQYILLINQQSIHIKLMEEELEYELDLSGELDESNVFSVREDIFEKMQITFIQELCEFNEEVESVISEKVEKVQKKQDLQHKNPQKFNHHFFQGLENEITGILQNIKTRLTHIQSCHNINQIPVKQKININVMPKNHQNYKYDQIQRLSTSPEMQKKSWGIESRGNKSYLPYLQPSKTINFQYTNKPNLIK